MLLKSSKWPKILPDLTSEQQEISNDFMKYWHEVLPKKYSIIEHFNHGYPAKTKPISQFNKTLEIGAGLGEHLKYENLSKEEESNYYSVEIRKNMLDGLVKSNPLINPILADCQTILPFEDNFFDRAIAIHVLEHLPNLPSALNQIHRVLKKDGIFQVVIPCEGGLAYSFARLISAQRIFEKRYKMPYDWFIKREHINNASEILEELSRKFIIESSSYFPLRIKALNFNLCVGLNLKPIQA